MADPLARVCLAVSAFRGSPQVVEMLAGIGGSLGRFGAVLVVDSGEQSSLGPKLPSSVVYHFRGPENLGSAGNLSERLRLGAATGCDWVFALNHDGVVDTDVIAKLVDVGDQYRRRGERIGAVYPNRRFPNRGGAYGKPASSDSVQWRWWATERDDRVRDTAWSSSNGALYHVEPLRAGLLPWAELWMGWEDLAFGWALEDEGYRQIIVGDAVLDDDYEFKTVGPQWLSLTLSDKPAWYSYYFARNLILSTNRLNRPKRHLARRIAAEFAALSFRSTPRQRLRLLLKGIIDGSLGRTGKAPDVP